MAARAAATAYNTVAGAAQRAAGFVGNLSRASMALPGAAVRAALGPGGTRFVLGQNVAPPPGPKPGAHIPMNPFLFGQGAYAAGSPWSAAGASGGGGTIPPAAGGTGGGWFNRWVPPGKYNLGVGTIPGAAAIGNCIGDAAKNIARRTAEGAILGAAATGVDALYEAGKLQQLLTTIRVASPGLMAPTAANDRIMDNIKAEAYNISNATAQSVSQSAAVMGVMASSGISAQQMLQRGKSGETFAEDVAKYADVQYLKTGGKVSFEEATTQAVRLAHLYGAYTPDKIAPILDEITKLSFQMPDSVSKYVNQSGYYAKLFGRFGVPQDQTMMLGAWLDRLGSGTKGGMWLQQLLLQTQKPLNYQPMCKLVGLLR